MQAMIALPDGSIAKVNVYKDGNTVTVVGMAKHQTPMGTSETVVQSRMSVDTFEWYRDQGIRQIASARGTLGYTRLLNAIGVSDRDVQQAANFDVHRAPPMLVQNQTRYLKGR